jgi:hypothetical protein
VTEAGDPGVLALTDETTPSKYVLASVSVNGLIPPALTAAPENSRNGLVVVLERLERKTPTVLNSELTVLFVARRRGPARVTREGATSAFVSLQHAPVSFTEKKLAPDWTSGPALKIEFVS